jgi:hypothetical protein
MTTMPDLKTVAYAVGGIILLVVANQVGPLRPKSQFVIKGGGGGDSPIVVSDGSTILKHHGGGHDFHLGTDGSNVQLTVQTANKLALACVNANFTNCLSMNPIPLSSGWTLAIWDTKFTGANCDGNTGTNIVNFNSPVNGTVSAIFPNLSVDVDEVDDSDVKKGTAVTNAGFTFISACFTNGGGSPIPFNCNDAAGSGRCKLAIGKQ